MRSTSADVVNSLSAIANSNISTPIVSFDLFDTLVRRKYLAVNEVHDTVSAYLIARLGKNKNITPGQITLARYNTGNFLKTSPHANVEEPTLPQIWQHIVSSIDSLKAEDRKQIINDVIGFEFDLELENLVLVDGTINLLNKLHSENKRLVAVSDMYFSKDQIELILSKLGILRFFEKVYVSATVGATKQTGNLFRYVMADLQEQPASIHHIGDNPHSDVEMAKSVGLSTTQVSQAEHLHIERPNYGQRQDIHLEISDLIKSFLAQVLFRSINNGADHIYFMSRDGLLINEILSAWKSPIVEKYLDGFKKSDLFLSRSTSCWLALNFRGEWLTQAVGFAFWLCHGNATLRQISDLFGIEEVPAALRTSKYNAAKDTNIVVKAYETAGLKEKVRASLIKKRQLTEDYLAESGVFSARHITLCDIGYSGTVARDLNSFFLQESFRSDVPLPPKVALELLSTNANYSTNAVLSQPYIRFDGSPILPHERLPDSLTDSFAWLEVFFKHPSYGPLQGYVREGTKVVPKFNDIGSNADAYPYGRIVAASKHRPEDIILLWMASINFWDQIADPLINRFAAPDLNTIHQMNVEIYEDDAVSDRKRSIILKRPDLTAMEIRQIAKQRDYWIPGSIVASAQSNHEIDTRSRSEQDNTSPKIASGAPLRTGRKRFIQKFFSPAKVRRTIGRKLRDARFSIANEGFSPNFYRTYYADLAELDDASSRRHFIDHGRKEGRFGNFRSLLANLEFLHGALPFDFDPIIYRALHSDLKNKEDWELRVHYLLFGRQERRNYRAGLSADDVAFEELVEARILKLTPEERAARKRGVSARQLVFDRSEIKPGAWLDLLHFEEFQALNYKWTGRLHSRAHAIEAFLSRGVAQLAPLSFRGRFEFDYYVRRHPGLVSGSPQDAYRFWLQNGAGSGEPACESDHVFQLLGEGTYPISFRPDLFVDRYLPAGKSGEQIDRIESLRLFLEGGYTADTDLAVGAGASRLWEAVARRARAHGQFDEALNAYENALAVGGPPGRIYHQIGDMFLAQQRWHDALDCYERSVASTNADRWSYINGARVAANLGYFEKALHFVEGGAKIWSGKEPWRRARDFVYDTWFAQASNSDKKSETSALKIPTALSIIRHINEEFSNITRLFESAGFILLLCDDTKASLPEQKLQQIRSFTEFELSRPVRIFKTSDSESIMASLPYAAGLVFHEPEFRPSIIRLVFAARSLSIPVTYYAGAIDGSDVPSFHDKDNATRTIAKLRDELNISFMSLCDNGIATLPIAARVLRRTTKHHKSALIGRLSRLTHGGTSGQRPNFVVQISDDSRDAQFQAWVWAGIEALLEQRPEIFIIYDQTASPPSRIGHFGARLRQADLRSTSADAIWLLSESAGMILFIRDDITDDESSLIGGREAALSGVPVCTIVGGGVGRKSESLERSRMISNVLAFVDHHTSAALGTKSVADQIEEPFFKPVNAPESLAPKPRGGRPRVLYANVFFPPQTIGGATRVLKDNIDYILDHHPNEFDLVVLTTDDENDRNNVTRIDSYRDIPVVRIATPQEVDMDWRPYNAQVYQQTISLLRSYRPDIVHVHCLQRLSVAVAEACRAEGIPYIVTLHDAWWLSDYSFLINESGELAMPSRDIYRQKYSDRIGLTESVSRGSQLRAALSGAVERLSVSESFAEIYRSCGFDVRVIANGVSRLKSRPRVAADKRVRLAHLGGTQHHKGIHVVEAILRSEKFDNLSFTYVNLFMDTGDVLETEWGTTPVTALGKIPSEEIEEIYSRTDVLLAPSIWPESFGLVSREALHHGCWVIAGKLGAMGDEIVNGANGFVVDMADPSELARVLREIDNNPHIYQRSPELKVDLRTADQQSGELVELYKEILEIK